MADDKKDWCCGKGWGHWVIKIIVILVVLGLVFAAGYSAGKLKETIKYGVFGDNDISQSMMNSFGVRFPFMQGWRGMMGLGTETGTSGTNVLYSGCRMLRGLGNYGENAKEVFGSVTKVDGTNITVMDNGAKEQMVVSTSDTVIYTSTGEVALSSLKAGQTVYVVAVMNNNQLEAKEIRVY